MRRSTNERDSWRLEERRKEARFKLILRAAIIEQGGTSSFCLVKNVSSTGVQLKLYTQLVLGMVVTLQVADEEAISGRVAWIDGDTAGISLEEELDAATLLRVQQKLDPRKRRAFPRLGVEARATLRTGGRVLRATVRDISSLGARVDAACELAAGDRTIVELADLPSIAAYVRWTEGSEVGLAFETPVPMQILALWVDGRSRVIA